VFPGGDAMVIEGKPPPQPLHPNCRCVMVPVMKGMEEQYRSPSYAEWLSRRNDEELMDILGPARFLLFKRGFTPDRFVIRDGRVLTLKELGVKRLTRKSVRAGRELQFIEPAFNPFTDDAFTKERMDNAKTFKVKTTTDDGMAGKRKADNYYREWLKDVWPKLTMEQKEAIWENTGHDYSKINTALRKNVWPSDNAIKTKVRQWIDNITAALDRSETQADIWLQRGVSETGFMKLLGINDMKELKVGLTGTDSGFMSTAVVRNGKFIWDTDVTLNLFVPKGAKGMYLEPIAQLGGNSMADFRTWDGTAKSLEFSNEMEMLLQRGTRIRVTKHRFDRNTERHIIDAVVIGQGL